MICLKNISKSYSRKRANGEKVAFRALDKIDYDIEGNKIYSIVGESGSGKSTLARVIAGIEAIDGGEMCYENIQINNAKFFKDKAVRKAIQLVQQDTFSALNPKLSVGQCILEPIKNLGHIEAKKQKERVVELLKLVELDEKYFDMKPTQLSGGQQKRVNIARAISSNPRLIVFDEATSGLDVVVKKKILDLLRKLQKESRCSLLFITHDIEVALYMSEDIAVMEKGKIVERVSYKNSFECFENDYSRTLIQSTFFENKNQDIRLKACVG